MYNEKKLTASDLFFNLYNEGTEANAQEFLALYPFFKEIFTAKELSADFINRE
jgi:hypothetical protein